MIDFLRDYPTSPFLLRFIGLKATYGVVSKLKRDTDCRGSYGLVATC